MCDKWVRINGRFDNGVGKIFSFDDFVIDELIVVGRLLKINNIFWRGIFVLWDGWDVVGGNFINFSGGFYDVGDNIKFGFLGVFVMIFLSWSVIEYKVKF